MGIKMTLVFALVLYLSYYYGNCEARGWKLTLKEELEIEKQLKILNKPAVKSIQYFGDLYDCVDFFKQPAFDNPLLKNHKYHFQMNSESFPTKKEVSRKSRDYVSANLIGLPEGGCPTGTVPIRRTTKEDLIRAKLFKHTCGDKKYCTLATGKKTYRAVARTQNVKNYKGGRTTLSVYAPTVTASQYSSGLMALGNGIDSIEVGWMVNPAVFGDAKCRTYIYTITNSSSCYNDCGKKLFVQTNPRIPLGAFFESVSTRGGKIYDMDFYIFQRKGSGEWRLAMDVNNTEIGFWPKEIFGPLRDSATYVEWGGEAKTLAGVSGPGMGSGFFPDGDVKKDGYCADITTVNDAYQFEDPVDTTAIFDDVQIYQAVDYGFRGTAGHLVEFGGPGPTA